MRCLKLLEISQLIISNEEGEEETILIPIPLFGALAGNLVELYLGQLSKTMLFLIMYLVKHQEIQFQIYLPLEL